jgi:hypothetical protein
VVPAFTVTVNVTDWPTAGFVGEAVIVVVVAVAATIGGVAVATAAGVVVDVAVVGSTAVVAASAAGVVVAAATAVVAAREVNAESVIIRAIRMAVDFKRLFMSSYLFFSFRR